jgi:hypothetical protein
MARASEAWCETKLRELPVAGVAGLSLLLLLLLLRLLAAARRDAKSPPFSNSRRGHNVSRRSEK